MLKMRIWLQKSASIQPRTSRLKNADLVVAWAPPPGPPRKSLPFASSYIGCCMVVAEPQLQGVERARHHLASC